MTETYWKFEEVGPAIRFEQQGPHVVALIARARVLTAGEAERLAAAWAAARAAARDAAWAAAAAAARDAAVALVVRDLIGQHGLTQDHYDTLTRTWRTVIGPIHPDDPEVTA